MSGIDRPFTGWGCGFVDYDNDGNLDLAIANGRVAKGPAHPEADVGPFWNRLAEQQVQHARVVRDLGVLPGRHLLMIERVDVRASSDQAFDGRNCCLRALCNL